MRRVYWRIWPECRTRIAVITEPTRVRIFPFDAFEMDRGYDFGE